MTSDARQGYSLALAREVAAADQRKIGVQFGLHCIERGIPVSEVAANFKVSRTSVYAWFRGTFTPAPEYVEEMQRQLDLAKAKSA